MLVGLEQYEAKKARLAEQMAAAGGAVALAKSTSNLFRKRETQAARLDVRDFHGVIALDPKTQTADVMGMTRYDELVDVTLAHGFMPTVVPQLRSITIGGAISGLGIESTSFRFGLVHETVQEIEVLLADGSVVVARPDNEHRQLFFGLPNSFGTLGYVLRAKVKLLPVKPFVTLTHINESSPEAFFKLIGQIVATGQHDGKTVDFLDGVVFERGHHYLTLGRMTDAAPQTSDYTYLKKYYESIPRRSTDHLSIKDYIWRWDADWFWCSKNIPGAQNRILRLLFGKFYLRSTFYSRLMALDHKYRLVERWYKLTGRRLPQTETIIQDVEIPLERCTEFLDFFQTEIGIKPVWTCPLKAADPKDVFPLYALDSTEIYVNFGFWDSIPTTHGSGHFNRLIEAKVEALGGRKSLYSESFYTRDKFWQLYNGPAYRKLKAHYDPAGRFKDLYDKCVKNK